MKRNWRIGLSALLGVLLLAGGATAFAFHGGHGPGGKGFMKHFVSATIDDALDQAQVTPQQREQIHTIRDRTFATLETHMQDRGAHMEQALELFEADSVDQAKVQTMRAQREAEMKAVGDAIQQAVIDAHAVLTTPQRKAVAEYVRSHHPHHGGAEHGAAGSTDRSAE